MAPHQIMQRAVELGAKGPEYGPNPRVGCVIVGADGRILGEGYHRGAGTAHAEVDALAAVEAEGASTQGASAYVTLEPCRHVGRTPPCVDALTAAGVAEVVYAVPDPGAASGGGGEELTSRGIHARQFDSSAARDLTRRWRRAVQQGRPYVIAKFAATLDGRTAAADGSSMWITGAESRAHVHDMRSRVDAIVVGTRTVVRDRPSLTARPGGKLASHQPLRVVVGNTAADVGMEGENVLALQTRDVNVVLAELADRDVRVALVEGGATLMTAFFAAGYVDEVHAYLAPALLGSGTSALGDMGIDTMGEVLRLTDVSISPLGNDVLVAGLMYEED